MLPHGGASSSPQNAGYKQSRAVTVASTGGGSGAGHSHSLRRLIDDYLLAETGERASSKSAHEMVLSLSLRFRCFHPSNCISWWNVRVYLSSVKAHELKRMEIFLSVCVLLLLLSVTAPIVVLLTSGTPRSLAFQSTTAVCGLLVIILAVFMARVLQMAVRLNQLAYSHINVLKQEMVAVLFRKTIKMDRAKVKAHKAFDKDVHAWEEEKTEHDQRVKANVKHVEPLRTCPVFDPPSSDEFAYMDTSMDLLQRMVDSLQEDYGQDHTIAATCEHCERTCTRRSCLV